MSVYPAIISIDLRRRKSGRRDICCCLNTNEDPVDSDPYDAFGFDLGISAPVTVTIQFTYPHMMLRKHHNIMDWYLSAKMTTKKIMKSDPGLFTPSCETIMYPSLLNHRQRQLLSLSVFVCLLEAPLKSEDQQLDLNWVMFYRNTLLQLLSWGLETSTFSPTSLVFQHPTAIRQKRIKCNRSDTLDISPSTRCP